MALVLLILLQLLHFISVIFLLVDFSFHFVLNLAFLFLAFSVQFNNTHFLYIGSKSRFNDYMFFVLSCKFTSFPSKHPFSPAFFSHYFSPQIANPITL